jgi:hypothetical protein
MTLLCRKYFGTLSIASHHHMHTVVTLSWDCKLYLVDPSLRLQVSYAAQFVESTFSLLKLTHESPY